MDALQIIKQINNYKRKVENMQYNLTPSKTTSKTLGNKDETLSTEVNNYEMTTYDSNMMNIGTIISMMIGIYASYLSYECNSKKNIPEIQKIMFAIFAYIFGLFYLIYYYLFQYETCL
jgi:hypothetical protein